MKKTGLVILGLLLLTGCFSKGMNLAYLTPAETPFESTPIFLKIKDMRQDKMIVTSAVMQKDLFKDVGDRVNLEAKSQDGKATKINNATITDSFYEAFRLRFASLGLGVLPEMVADNFALIIEIQKVELDIDERTFKAEISYLAKFYNGTKEFQKEQITGSTEKMYVIGKSGGEEALSEAFESAINSLNLRPFQQ